MAFYRVTFTFFSFFVGYLPDISCDVCAVDSVLLGCNAVCGGCIVFDVSKECSAFIFSVKQSSARIGLFFGGVEGLWELNAQRFITSQTSVFSVIAVRAFNFA